MSAVIYIYIPPTVTVDVVCCICVLGRREWIGHSMTTIPNVFRQFIAWSHIQYKKENAEQFHQILYPSIPKMQNDYHIHQLVYSIRDKGYSENRDKLQHMCSVCTQRDLQIEPTILAIRNVLHKTNAHELRWREKIHDKIMIFPTGGERERVKKPTLHCIIFV